MAADEEEARYDTQAEKMRTRDRLLLALYEATDGDPLNGRNPDDLAAVINATTEVARQAAEYLVNVGLVQYPTFGSEVVLTRDGLARAEELARDPDFLTAAVVFVTSEQVSQLEPLLAEIRQHLDSLPADTQPDDAADLQAQLETVQVQLKSPRPRKAIVREALKSLRNIAENAVAAGIAEAALKALNIVG